MGWYYLKSKIDNYDLWSKFQKENSELAREKIILNNLDIVKYQARRVSALIPNYIDEDDLQSYGMIGLIEAVERFNPEMGYKFSTFASKRVRGAIIDYLRDLDWLPHSIRTDAKKIINKKEDLKNNEFSGDISELADRLDLSESRIKKVLRYFNASQWLSLDTEYEDATLLDIVSSSIAEPDKKLDKETTKAILIKAVDKLNEQERLVVSLYYYEELTQEEIAEVLELSTARISQIHKKSIQRLRGYLANKKTDLF